MLSLIAQLFLVFAVQLIQADDCQPSTWNRKRAVGDINCRYTTTSPPTVNYYTCTELALKYGLSIEVFFQLNPGLDRDCATIKPNAEYCVRGLIQQPIAENGQCGPDYGNATCLGTEFQCCNSKTWKCGNSDTDCSIGVCHSGACMGRGYTTNGQCGPKHGGLKCGGPWGDCCSFDGFCGTGDKFCGKGACESGNCAQPVPATPAQTGYPWQTGTTPDGTCGGEHGYTCDVVFGTCCNKNGFCGSLMVDCGVGCQSRFGKCDGSQTPSSTTSAATATSPTSSSVPVSQVPKRPDAPSPAQPNIARNCERFHFVTPGQSCDNIASENSITLNDFLNWNQKVGKDCGGLMTNAYACVAVSQNYKFEDGTTADWTTFGGAFEVKSGALTAGSSFGGKALLSTPFTDFTLEADLVLPDGSNGNAGLVFRASNPVNGENSYQGYFAGISSDGYVILGRANNDWRGLGDARLDFRPGQVYHMMVRANGDSLDVYVDDMGRPKISVKDGTYRGGMNGVRVWRTGATFDNIRISPMVYDGFDDGVLAGWTTYDGSFDAGSKALVAGSSFGGKALLNTYFDNFTLEADIVLPNGSNGNAGLVFRASNPVNGENSYQGYFAGISSDGYVILGRANNDWRGLGDARLDFRPGQVYHMVVRTNGNSLDVYVDDMGRPKISVNDGTYRGGMNGVRVWRTGATFDNIRVTPVKNNAVYFDFNNGNLVGWTTYDGSFDAGSKALVAGSSFGGKALLNTYFDDFTLEADIVLPNGSNGNAGLVFRASDPVNGENSYRGYFAGISSDGYVILGRANNDWRGLGDARLDFRPGQVYHMMVQANGDSLNIYVDDMGRPKISVKDGTYRGGINGVRVWRTGATFDNISITGPTR